MRIGAFGRDADTAAIYERIGNVTFVVPDGPVDGGDTHFVAVVLNAGHHARGNAARMQHTFRQRFNGRVRGAEAQHVRGGNRFGGNADHVTDDAADAGVGAAKGFNGGGVVVGFHFETDLINAVEFHDAGVLGKG